MTVIDQPQQYGNRVKNDFASTLDELLLEVGEDPDEAVSEIALPVIEELDAAGVLSFRQEGLIAPAVNRLIERMRTTTGQIRAIKQRGATIEV